jgi:hypothetical protein
MSHNFLLPLRCYGQRIKFPKLGEWRVSFLQYWYIQLLLMKLHTNSIFLSYTVSRIECKADVHLIYLNILY